MTTGQRSVGRVAPVPEAERAGGDADGERLVVRCLSGEGDHRALESTDERQSDRPRGRPGRNRSVFSSRVDQANEAPYEPCLDPLELAPDRMVAAAELDAQRHRDASDVAPAQNRVTAGHRQ